MILFHKMMIGHSYHNLQFCFAMSITLSFSSLPVSNSNDQITISNLWISTILKLVMCCAFLKKTSSIPFISLQVVSAK